MNRDIARRPADCLLGVDAVLLQTGSVEVRWIWMASNQSRRSAQNGAKQHPNCEEVKLRPDLKFALEKFPATGGIGPIGLSQRPLTPELEVLNPRGFVS
jgi:hypothetical protein